MAATANADTLLIRCPYCLFEKRVGKATKTTEALSCGRCKRRFELQNALPVKSEITSTVTPEQRRAVGSYQRDTLLFWLLGVPLSIIVFLFIDSQGRALSGLEFMVLYVVTFLGLRFAVFVLRAFWWDTTGVTVYGFLVFEAVGASRFIYGYFFNGMHDFELLAGAMAFGGFLFFAHYEPSGRASRKRRDGGGSGTTGCGGCGSCGGGGCGGCGG
jgi:hypothetical protein